MSARPAFLDVDSIRQAWNDAGRPGLLSAFNREYRAKHQQQASAAPRVELYIRRKGTRRFADWRIAGSNSGWSWVEITKADRAAREGRISVGSFTDAEVVLVEEPVTQ